MRIDADGAPTPSTRLTLAPTAVSISMPRPSAAAIAPTVLISSTAAINTAMVRIMPTSSLERPPFSPIRGRSRIRAVLSSRCSAPPCPEPSKVLRGPPDRPGRALSLAKSCAGRLIGPAAHFSHHLLESTTNFVTADVHADEFRFAGNPFPPTATPASSSGGWWLDKKIGFRGGVYEGYAPIDQPA